MEPWQEPPRGRAFDPALLALSGLDQMRAMMSPALAPPVSRLTGLRPTSVGAGSCTFVMPSTGWLAGAKGFVHTGMLAFLADAPLGFSILSSVPARTPITTSELSMTFLGPAPPVGGTLIGQGKLIYADEPNGLSEVFVTDHEGRLVAHGTSRCFIFPPLDLPSDLSRSEIPPEPAGLPPDPYLREPPETVAADPGMSGLEIFQAAIKGDLPLPGIDLLTGIRPVEAEEGRVVFTMPASGWTMNPAGTIYGGIIACLAKSASSGAAQTIAPAGTRYTALDVKVNYLRPGVVGGGELVATGTVLRRGKRLVISTAEVVQDGKQVALATGSTALE